MKPFPTRAWLARLGAASATMIAIGIVAYPADAQIPCGYEVTAVIQGPWCGDIFGYPPTFGRGISEDGAVVGHYSSCLIGPGEAFVWSPESGLLTLERPPGFSSAGALGVDDQGTWIVGAMTPQGTNVSTAALWADGVPIDLGTLPGGNWSQARATNGVQIVGKWGNNITGPTHGFIWEAGVMTSLGPDLGTPSSHANNICQTTGKIVGWMGSGFLQNGQAYIWDSGKVIPLPNPPDMFSGRAHGISPNGKRVVGAAQLDDGSTFGVTRAVLWENKRPIVLGTLPGEEQSSALDVRVDNDVLQVVGGSGGAGFIWQSGVMTDLNTLISSQSGIEIIGARTINSQGQITGRAHNDQPGDVVAFLLTPIESPVGDLDSDCAVDILDLLILLSNWGPCPDPPDPCAPDLDGSGSVGIIDLLTLLANWG